MQVFILYPGLAQASLSVFACYKVDDGSPPYPETQRVGSKWRMTVHAGVSAAGPAWL